MQLENLYYALTQIVHNYGALAIVGGAFAGLKTPVENLALKRKLAWLVLSGWAIQTLSGIVFGGISLHFYGETPDLHLVASLALGVKVLCAVSGFTLALLYLKKTSQLREARCQQIWRVLTVLGGTALIAAAFLRWFS